MPLSLSQTHTHDLSLSLTDRPIPSKRSQTSIATFPPQLNYHDSKTFTQWPKHPSSARLLPHSGRLIVIVSKFASFKT